MNILIPDSWLREFLDTDAAPKDIQRCLSLCGPSVERLHQKDNDFIYDIEVTTNRVDMMSVVGIAFECVAILPQFGFTAKFKNDPYKKKLNLLTKPSVSYLKVKIDKELCDRFSAVLIRNTSIGKSPEIITRRLELVGMRSLNNIVDISNYLMLEMGQPVHTFDYDKILKSEMILRKSIKGEKIVTLDEKIHSLPGGDIIIEDGSGKIIDLCGIMGGLNSAVDANTKNVLLFVQVYKPSNIRQTSMALAHRTDAAVLFEKGLPVENVLPTLKLGIELFQTNTGGNPEEIILDILNVDPKPSVIKLKTPITEQVNSMLGVTLSFSEISKILSSLEFTVKSEYEIEIPWVRKADITISEDLVEEVARIYGYHNIPPVLMSGCLPPPPDSRHFSFESKIKTCLKYLGFIETYTYSLVNNDPHGLQLSNPLTSDWTTLRTKLFPSHLLTIKENQGRLDTLNFFEIAAVYLPRKNDLPEEQLHLLISSTDSDFYRFKGKLETLLNDLNIKNLSLDIKSESGIFYWEIPINDLLSKASSVKAYVQPSKFAPIYEDLNIIHSGAYSDILSKIKSVSPLIKQIDLVDKYGDKLTLRLTFNSDKKQLSSEDIVPVRQSLSKII